MKYTTKEKIKTSLAILILIAEIAAGIRMYAEEKRERENIWIGSYPMANANITWEGAGYSFQRREAGK